ncbi:superoxide dismutase, Ni [Candidatus Saccharibacteria bacterium]|nr:superoxide dismutase, Ni [Candidatus Saccharibacteria bacterium]
MKLPNFLPVTTVYAHCDLPCGIYDPAQARIEAASVYAITKKYLENEAPDFRTRALIVKEERAELVKHHLWVLWTDYFKPEHLEKYPQLHDLVWKATKTAGDTKHHTELEVAKQLLDQIDTIGEIFAATKPGYDYAAVIKNTNLQAGL